MTERVRKLAGSAGGPAAALAGPTAPFLHPQQPALFLRAPLLLPGLSEAASEPADR